MDGKIETNPEEILKLKDGIVACWERLPPEHQATMLLVLLDGSSWANWSLQAHTVLQPKGEGQP